jgi:hypothetical protein
MQKQKHILKMVVSPALFTLIFLTIPLTAMYFFSAVAWSLSDFVIAGVLIFGTGVLYKFVTLSKSEIWYKTGMGLAFLAGLTLIWVNMAAGIVGTENNPFNLVYVALIAAALAGLFVIRFKQKRVVVLINSMAAAMALIGIIAIITGQQFVPESSVVKILAVHGFFALLFVISALLLRFSEKTMAMQA